MSAFVVPKFGRRETVGTATDRESTKERKGGVGAIMRNAVREGYIVLCVEDGQDYRLRLSPITITSHTSESGEEETMSSSSITEMGDSHNAAATSGVIGEEDQKLEEMKKLLAGVPLDELQNAIDSRKRKGEKGGEEGSKKVKRVSNMKELAPENRLPAIVQKSINDHIQSSLYPHVKHATVKNVVESPWARQMYERIVNSNEHEGYDEASFEKYRNCIEICIVKKVQSIRSGSIRKLWLLFRDYYLCKSK